MNTPTTASTMSPCLPSVLQAPNNNSIAMYRALRQIKWLLERHVAETTEEEDRLNASLDDVEIMLKAVKA